MKTTPEQRSKQILLSKVALGTPGWVSHWVAHENYFNKKNLLADERALEPMLESKKDAQITSQIQKLVAERILLNISGDRLLNESIILIGGAALYYGHNFPKKTFDLDFTWKNPPSTDDKLRVISRLKDMAKENSGIFGQKLTPRQKAPKKGDEKLTFENYVFSYLLEGERGIEQYVQNRINFKINFTIKQEKLSGVGMEDNSVIKVECGGCESLFEPLKLVTGFGHILYQNLEDLFYGKILAAVGRGKKSDFIHLKQIAGKRGKEIDLVVLRQKIQRVEKAGRLLPEDVEAKAKEIIEKF
ncbi:hypothetical protein COU37_03825 [Candidatus Micrarchaeota archaeon CG10_big_fil_rev_8_21_14_0_10_45_29]|nr:MAG: hypothetical protein COU37_03825 [Candidatus Micrarchaeota archaeon CG10_big_fil_rev_8_21_14_0_10_45_29]